VDSRRDELRKRLGGYRVGTRRELATLAGAVGTEPVASVAIGVWLRRSWVVAATSRELLLSRHPRLFGKSEFHSWPWSQLRGIRSGTQQVDFVFGDETVALWAISPHNEFVHLLDTARRRAPGPSPTVATEDLRDSAKIQVGDDLASQYEASIDSLPDRLLEHERVQLFAAASLDFNGLLFVTDRRVILFEPGLVRAAERFWAVDRSELRRADVVEDGLHLELGQGAVTLTEVLPDGRAAELAASLRPN